MADLEVIYDARKEMAAIVHVDERRSWGPAMVGDNAGELLQAWLDAMPFDPTILDERVAVSVYQDWLRQIVAATPEVPPSPPVSPQEPVGVDGVGDDAIADYVAAHSPTEPPDVAPADTDLDANEGAPLTVIVCPLCGGDKVVTAGEDEVTQPCGMCGGVGMVSMAATP